MFERGEQLGEPAIGGDFGVSVEEADVFVAERAGNLDVGLDVVGDVVEVDEVDVAVAEHEFEGEAGAAFAGAAFADDDEIVVDAGVELGVGAGEGLEAAGGAVFGAGEEDDGELVAGLRRAALAGLGAGAEVPGEGVGAFGHGVAVERCVPVGVEVGVGAEAACSADFDVVT